MRKNIRLLASVITMCLGLSSVAYAGTWVQDTDKKNVYGPDEKKEVSNWWYQEDDGSYPAGTWKEIGGKWYYFNEDGWMLKDTTTPDHSKVDKNGVWIPGFLDFYPDEVGYRTLPSRFYSNDQSRDVVFTDPGMIAGIVKQLGEISVEELDPATDTSVMGMATILTLKAADGSSQEIHYCGPYLISGTHKYRLSATDGTAMNAVLYQTYGDWLNAQGFETTPAGIVDSIQKDSSGNEISFRINCAYPSAGGRDITITYQVKKGDAPVLDAAGDNWMILHDGDKVQVVYDSNADGVLTAKAILIREHGTIY